MKQKHIATEAKAVVPLLMGWISDGALPRSRTLSAILRNDLTDTYAGSNEASRWLLPALLDWLKNCAPADAWSSETALECWADTNGKVEIHPGDATEHPNIRRKRVLNEHPFTLPRMREELILRLKERTDAWPPE